MIKLDEAREKVLAGLSALPPEDCGLDTAIGRVLCDEVKARYTLPPFDNSAMDGYAVRAAETRGAGGEGSEGVVLPVAFEVAAGACDLPALDVGKVARIFTGAPMPEGADAVVMQERTRPGQAAGTVCIVHEARVGENVRPRGDSVEAGQVVLPAGVRLGAPEISAALSQGRTIFSVHRRPRVAIFSSGNELVEADREPGPGQIISSNSQALAAACRLEGASATVLGTAADRPEAIASLVEEGRHFDLLLSSGGVSVGDHDHVREVLIAAGLEEVFWKVAMKPGKPLLFGHLQGRPVFGLPGNPVSALVGFFVFVRPVLRQLQGLSGLPLRSPARLAAPAKGAHGRAQVLFVRRIPASRDPGLLSGELPLSPLEVEPLSRQASHRTASIAGAEGLVLLPPDESLPAGSQVLVEWIGDGPPCGV